MKLGFFETARGDRANTRVHCARFNGDSEVRIGDRCTCIHPFFPSGDEVAEAPGLVVSAAGDLPASTDE